MQVMVEKRRNVQINYVGLPLPELPARFRTAVHNALQAAFRWWHKRVAPDHFTQFAYSRYGGMEQHVYDRRKGMPEWMRERWFSESGGEDTNPLVQSGSLRRAFLNYENWKTTGSGSDVKLVARWPQLPKYTYYFNPNQASKFHMSNRRTSRPLIHNKARELVVVNDDEQKRLLEVFGKALTREVGSDAGDLREAMAT